MANYIKSFNFRSGVQVDNDNFIVNAAGRVGIGTTTPDKLLDVRGNAKIVGHVTATDLSVSGIVTVGNIKIDGNTGKITATNFEGSAGQSFGDQGVVAIATEGFIASGDFLSTTRSVGVNTTNPEFTFQVGNNPTTSIGFGVTSGNITASGNLKISGISTLGVTTTTNLTTQNLNVSGVSTFTTLKVGTGITAESGIITATTFSGNLTGNVTGNLTGNVTGNLYSTGVSTFTTLKVGTGITAESGIITATTFSGSVYSTGVSTFTTLKVGTDITAESGIITATTFDGNAGTATSLASAKNFSISGDVVTQTISFDGTDVVGFAVTLASDFSANTSGIITAATIVGSAGSFTSIGIKTSSPSVDLQIRKASGESKIEVISDTGTASISIGNNVGTGNSSASINYGSVSGFGVFSTNDSFNIIQRDSGYFNYFLPSTTDSAFVWHKGSSNQLMSLTHDGNLGIGITDPAHKLDVQGISTFTGSAHFNSNVTIDGTLTISSVSATFKGDVQDTSNNLILDVSNPLLNANVNTTTGISTFNNVKASAVGIGTTSPRCILDLEEATDNDTGFVLFPSRTTAGRNNISPLIEGALIYNKTLKRLEFYNGTAWVGVTTEA